MICFVASGERYSDDEHRTAAANDDARHRHKRARKAYSRAPLKSEIPMSVPICDLLRHTLDMAAISDCPDDFPDGLFRFLKCFHRVFTFLRPGSSAEEKALSIVRLLQRACLAAS